MKRFIEKDYLDMKNNSRKGRRYNYFYLNYKEDVDLKVGVVISKKITKAVLRNKLKRIIYEFMRQNSRSKGKFLFVFHSWDGNLEKIYSDLNKVL